MNIAIHFGLFLELPLPAPSAIKSFNMITHTVQFRFKQGLSTDETAAFMNALHDLSSIPGVLDFGIFEQVNAGNTFQYLATMRFKTREVYQAYSDHPQHRAFIKDQWIPKIDSFLEGDYLEWQA